MEALKWGRGTGLINESERNAMSNSSKGREEEGYVNFRSYSLKQFSQMAAAGEGNEGARMLAAKELRARVERLKDLPLSASETGKMAAAIHAIISKLSPESVSSAPRENDEARDAPAVKCFNCGGMVSSRAPQNNSAWQRQLLLDILANLKRCERSLNNVLTNAEVAQECDCRVDKPRALGEL